MGKYHKPSERLEIVKDYFNSNCSIREYAKDHNIANSTLADWIREYKLQYGLPQSNEGFINVTNEIKNNRLIESEGVVAIHNETVIPDVKTTSNTVKIKHPSGVEFEFDVSVLDKVVKALL